MTNHGCSAISPRTWRGTATSGSTARCESSSPNFAGSPAPPFGARYWPRSVVRINRWRSFFGVDRVNRNGIAKLLAAMKRHSKPVAPKHLGIIGAEHFKQRFLAAGGNVDTFKYQCRKDVTDDGIPYVVEFAFGLHQSGSGRQGGAPCPALHHRRELERRDQQSVPRLRINRGRIGEHAGEGAGQRQSAGRSARCIWRRPASNIADRGKSSIILTDDAEQPDD